MFISAISGLGIAQLKDILWTELNRESNQLKGTETLVHRAKDRTILPEELRDMGEDEDLTVGVEDVPEDLDDFDYEYEEDEE